MTSICARCARPLDDHCLMHAAQPVCPPHGTPACGPTLAEKKENLPDG